MSGFFYVQFLMGEKPVPIRTVFIVGEPSFAPL
jgi:hypothetical protein